MKAAAPSKRDDAGPAWDMLIHQLPPEPLYLRAKIRQRLLRAGAVALKNAVYVLPRREETLGVLREIAEEALAGGGQAYVCEARFLESRTDDSLVEEFQAHRRADYEALANILRESRRGRKQAPPPLARARRQFKEIARIDFFQSPAKHVVDRLLRGLEKPRAARKAIHPRGIDRALVGRTWVTRRGIHVDRIASAWLIRRFVDPKARFRFVDPGEPPVAGQLRFDIAGGDFSHEGDRCTFETLLSRTKARDGPLSEIAQIVHDIDLKDGRFGRPEAAGVEKLLTGLMVSNPDDEIRLARGLVLFDDLYQSFGNANPFTKEARK